MNRREFFHRATIEAATIGTVGAALILGRSCAPEQAFAEERCLRCDGEGWVCENHPDQPWYGGTPDCCGGAGAPCPDCSPFTQLTESPFINPEWRFADGDVVAFIDANDLPRRPLRCSADDLVTFGIRGR